MASWSKETFAKNLSYYVERNRRRSWGFCTYGKRLDKRKEISAHRQNRRIGGLFRNTEIRSDRGQNGR